MQVIKQLSGHGLKRHSGNLFLSSNELDSQAGGSFRRKKYPVGNFCLMYMCKPTHPIVHRAVGPE